MTSDASLQMHETTSAMVKLTKEIDESSFRSSLSLSAASRLRNASFRCVLPETAGHKPENVRDKMRGRWRAERRAKDTASAMVEIAQEIDEMTFLRGQAGGTGLCQGDDVSYCEARETD